MPEAKIRSLSLYYEVEGKGQPILLISGLNSDNASWAGVRGQLARHFHVIVFDNRGSGRSDTPDRKYSIRIMADDAIGLLDHLRIEMCHVVGHSMGGYIAQEMAIRHPSRIGKLILESTAPASSARNNTLFNDFLERFEKYHDNEDLMRSWSCWLFSRKAFERKNYIATFVKEASSYPYLQSAEGFKRQIEAIAGFNACARIKNIKAKTLVIAGSDDILIFPAESMRLANGIRGSFFEEIEDVGHCAHVEEPGKFISKVEKFLYA